MAKTSQFVLTEDEQRTLRIENELRRRGYTGIVMVDFIPDLKHVRYYTARQEQGETVMLGVTEDSDSQDVYNVLVYRMTEAFVLTI
jgi:hypothetical protein